ncbi:histidine kinase [Gordonia sp. CPCC 206044]|uniref:sensor histidine kinase n=1 Tax=Gordonia sp. CPCC 206044 TaxID=3140793 RepID=UPI003AF39341
MRSLARIVKRRLERVGGGYPPLYPAVILSAMVAVTVASVAQRLPIEPPWWALFGLAVAVMSLATDLWWAPSRVPCTLFAMVATGLMLMDPVPADVAPLLLVLTTATVAAMERLAVGLTLGAMSMALVIVAGYAGHLPTAGVYALAIACGWLLGYMVLNQKLLAENAVRAQRERADRAAAEERRRIAREIHDVIAHSLSITMLNVTGARRALQEGATDEAADALGDAEQLGRQAMTEIRYIVKILGSQDEPAAPTPGATDIDRLVADYRKAGVAVSLEVDGDMTVIPGPVGSALYRITQESLANVVKHSRQQCASVRLSTGSDIVLCVQNPIAQPVGRPGDDGSGVEGMKQRAQLLGGVVDAGGGSGSWTVRAVFPAGVLSEQRAG